MYVELVCDSLLLALQSEESKSQCRELSQELVNLRGELGKLGHLGLM